MNARFARAILAAVLALLCGAPIVWGYATIFREPAELASVWASGALNRLVRSIGCAAATSAAATLLGCALSLGWASLSARYRALAMAMTCLPLVLPPYVYALAWIEVVGTLHRAFGSHDAAPAVALYSMQGVVFIESLRYAPLAAGAAWIAARYADRAALEAALLTRGPAAAFVNVAMPLAWPLVSAAALAIFLLTLSDSAIASLLQVDLYPIDIQTQFSANYNIAGAFALTIPLALIGSAAIFGCAGYAARSETPLFDPEPVQFVSRGIATAGVVSFAGIAALAPVSVVAIRTGSFAALAAAWQSVSGEFYLSVAAALVSTAIALSLAIGLAGLFKSKLYVLAISAAPLVITGPAFGIGAILFWNQPGFRATIFDSTAILVVVETARVLLIPLLGAIIGFTLQSPDLQHAAALAGVSPRSRFFGIALPLAYPAFAAAAAFAFLFAFADADSAALVAPPGATPLAVRIAGLMHYGPSGLVHAASLLSVAVSLAIVLPLAFLLRRGLVR